MKKDFLPAFIKHLASLKNEAEIELFLRAVLTAKELEEIPKRLEIVKQLKQGIPQHQIAENLGVGVATVTRGSKELKSGKFANVVAEK
jgi:TrpR family trp operon transcriptional repressor